MKKSFVLLGISLAVLLSIPLQAQGTWSLQNNPLGSGPSAMVGKVQFVTSTEGWMSSEGGSLLHTTDSGINWTIVTPFPDDTVYSFADPSFNLCFINQTTGWIVKSFGTWMNDSHGTVIYKTTDGGNSWERHVVSDSSGVVGGQLQFIDANNGWLSVFNTATGEMKLLKTTDGGDNWNKVSSLPPNDETDIFYFTDQNTGWVTSINDNPPSFQIAKTTDGGSTFNEQYSDNTANANTSTSSGAMQFTDADHGWVVGPNGRILKTTDGGVNWKLLTNSGIGAYANSKCLFFLDSNTGWIGASIFVSDQLSEHKIIHTTDGGKSWTEEQIPFSHEAVFSIFFLNQQEGWFAGDHGMIAHYNEFTNAGTLNISLVNHDIPQITQNNKIWFVDEYGGNVWITNESSVIAKSKDLQNWDVLNNGIQHEGIGQLEFLNSDTIFAAGQSGTIYRTFDGGQNWNIVYQDTNQTNFINKIKFFDNMNGIAMGDQAPNASTLAILNTTDGGNTWENYNKYIYGYSSINLIDFAPPSYVYMCGYVPNTNPAYQGIWKSVDRGQSWSFRYVGNTTKDSLTVVTCVKFKDKMMGYAAKEDSSVWMTLDGGYTWADIYHAPSDINSIIIIDNSSSIYCVGNKGLIAKINTEPAISIQQEIGDTSENYYYGNFVNENKGYLIDNNGNHYNFFTTFAGPTKVNNNDVKITSYSLSQNYPNPFNPTTTINYTVPKSSFVTIKLYDILGKEVAALVNKEEQAGTYKIEVNGNNLASGIYFYRMQAGNFYASRKFILLK